MFVIPVPVCLEIETNKTVRAVFLNQNAAFSEAVNQLNCHNSFGTMSATKSLRNKHLNMNFSAQFTSVSFPQQICFNLFFLVLFLVNRTL